MQKHYQMEQQTLAEGIQTFNEQGIKKICNYINGDLRDVAERTEKN